MGGVRGLHRREQESALHEYPVRLPASGSPGERMDDAPAPEALAVQGEEIGERVQSSAKQPLRIRVPGELIAPVVKQGGRIEGRIAHQRFRVDREPWLALRAKDVLRMQVLMEHD